MPTNSYTSLTPLAFLERAADVFANKTAIAYGDRRVSYSEFGAEATQLAHALRASGVQPGDRVAYLCPNIPEMLVANFGVPLAGAVLVPINTRLSAEEVRYICDHAGAQDAGRGYRVPDRIGAGAGELRTVEEVVAVDDPLGPARPDAAGRAHLLRRAARRVAGGAAALGGRGRDEPDLDQLHIGDDGHPEGRDVRAPRRLPELARRDHPQRFDPESVYLWTLPMFHCNGWCTRGRSTASVPRTCACGRCART